MAIKWTTKGIWKFKAEESFCQNITNIKLKAMLKQKIWQKDNQYTMQNVTDCLVDKVLCKIL